MKLVAIAGTRPNFVKLAALSRECNKVKLPLRIIHTGQHYDKEMSDNFFADLEIPKPDVYLGVNGGRFEDQIGTLIPKLSSELTDPEEWVVVMGDSVPVTAGSIAAKAKERVLIHIESGLRSYNRAMPEEQNRLVSDALADIWFTTEEKAIENLPKARDQKLAFFVGNIMLDNLVFLKEKITSYPNVFNTKPYALITLHRKENVDDVETLKKYLTVINKVAKDYISVVFPIHPRTKLLLTKNSLQCDANVTLTEPLSYLHMQKILSQAKFVLTDSGGVQEEATWWNIPCLTLREETERPITIEVGTNTLVAHDQRLIEEKINEINLGTYKKGVVPPLWDGNAAERIIKALFDVEKNYRLVKNGLVKID